MEILQIPNGYMQRIPFFKPNSIHRSEKYGFEKSKWQIHGLDSPSNNTDANGYHK